MVKGLAWFCISFGIVGIAAAAIGLFVEWGYANGLEGMFAVGLAIGLLAGAIVGLIAGEYLE